MVGVEFLTPPDIPETEECRTLTIPQSLYWLGVFNSALLDLTDPAKWKQVNESDITPEEAAEKCFQIYENYIASGTDCTMPTKPPQTSLFEQLLDASESAGNTSGGNYVTRDWTDEILNIAPVVLGEDGQTFTLQPGWWHVRAEAPNQTTNRAALRLYGPGGVGQTFGESVLSTSVLMCVDAWLYFISGTVDLQVDQYCASTVTSGLGSMSPSRGGTIARVWFERFDEYPDA